MERFCNIAESFVEKSVPSEGDWERWADSLGFNFPNEYVEFHKTFPNAWVGEFLFVQPQTGRELIFDDAAFAKERLRRRAENEYSNFSVWPEAGGFFPVADAGPIVIAIRVSDDGVDEERWYVIDRDDGEAFAFQGSYFEFMEFMLFGEPEEPLVQNAVQLFREEGANGKIILNVPWPTIEHDRLWISQVDDEFRDKIRKADD